VVATGSRHAGKAAVDAPEPGPGGPASGRWSAGHPGLAAAGGLPAARAGIHGVPGKHSRTRRSRCQAPLRFSLRREAALIDHQL